MSQITGADIVYKAFEDHGVVYIFGYPGGAILPLYDELKNHKKIKHILVRHEQGAGHAAIGESKFTGKPSVVNPTTGCGGTNCITSVLNAWQDSVPVIFISGNVKLENCSRWINKTKKVNIRKLGVQEHDIINTVESITKKAFFVSNIYNVAEVLQEAFFIAQSGRPGPVWIDIPADIQSALMPSGYLNFIPPKFFNNNRCKYLESGSEL